MPFYVWDQNNSGGSFDFDEQITHRVVIEADTYEKAESVALGMGIYYDGCAKGVDCPCCGDRWYYGEEFKVPKKYIEKDYGYGFHLKWNKFEEVSLKERNLLFDDIFEYLQFLTDNYGWKNPDARVFFKDGTVREFFRSA